MRMTTADRGATADAVRQLSEFPEGHESVRTVVFAFSLNFALATGKAIAAAITGSASLFAEAAHSAADAGNELLLYVALVRSRRPADATHPYGYGQELYYWALLAAIGLFVGGGVLSVREGLSQLFAPEELSSVGLGYAVLAASLVADSISWMIAYRQLRGEARTRGVSVRAHLKTTTDTTVPAVFLEDSADIIGVVLAMIALTAHELTGSSMPDAIVAVIIGAILIRIARDLARRNRDLLTDRAASPAHQQHVRTLLLADPRVRDVTRLVTVFMGPHKLLVSADVVLDPALDYAEACRVLATVRTSLCALPAIVDVHLTPIQPEEAQREDRQREDGQRGEGQPADASARGDADAGAARS